MVVEGQHAADDELIMDIMDDRSHGDALPHSYVFHIYFLDLNRPTIAHKILGETTNHRLRTTA